MDKTKCKSCGSTKAWYYGYRDELVCYLCQAMLSIADRSIRLRDLADANLGRDHIHLQT